MESIIQEALKEASNEVGSDLAVPRIVVMGVGGAGCNTVNRLAKVGIRGAELIAVNTDKKHLSIISESAKRVLIGQSITRGLGAGGYPEVALKAVEASRQELETILADTHLLFIAAGMGGGTGTGAAPAIADLAKQEGAIVVAIVTYPFELERARLKKAEVGIEALRRAADTIIVIDNNRLVEFFPNLPIDRAFNVADEITARAVRGITETITTPSLINIDFADVRAIMGGGGVSMIAVGEAKGTDRVQELVKNTLHHRLLDVDYRGATGVLLHLTGGGDMTLGEANQIGELLTEEVEPTANVIWGARLDASYEGRIEALAIFTGIKSPYIVGKPKREPRWSLGEV
ncbi:cell division protein FtsZ [Candidatus Micrarchaeota archaeon]|nr:cell division protein FtsZ [Candidatus Micrarchaeota archaeon]